MAATRAPSSAPPAGRGADTLTGGDGDDLLRGRAGADRIDGGAEAIGYRASPRGVDVDRLRAAQFGGEAAGDMLSEIEAIRGSGFADMLRGDAGANAFEGGTGNDRLVGLGSADRLTGGAGSDHFVYTALVDSRHGAADIITDFTAGSDRIDLSGLDAIATRAGNQKFAFIGGAAFGAPGQLRIETAAGVTTLHGNVDADLGADLTIMVQATTPLTMADLLL